MAHFFHSFSYNPKYAPAFELLNSNGTKFRWVPEVDNINKGVRFDPESELYPRFAKCTGRTIKLPDTFRLSSFVCVNENLRNLIESFEKIHSFFKIELANKNEELFDGEYYIFNICTLLNSLVVKDSNLIFAPSGKKDNPYYITEGPAAKDFRTLFKKMIGNHHIWREALYPKDIYFSDAFFKQFKEHKFKGIESHYFGPAYEV